MQARPFCKWVGGKTQLLPELLKRVSTYRKFYEPFVGGGALFFALHPDKAVLNDSNKKLIDTYIGIRDNVENVIRCLNEYAAAHSEKFYYEARKLHSDDMDPVDTAAWTIYMNKTGFNGLYRVNRSGGYNVPWGRHESFTPDVYNLRACSKSLKNVDLLNEDFRQLFQKLPAERGDFVYFDCPYAPLTATSDFTSYTAEGFGAQEQQDLRDIALELKSRGVHVLLSNSSAPLIRDLYSKGFVVEEVQARRSINSKGTGRGAITELLIS